MSNKLCHKFHFINLIIRSHYPLRFVSVVSPNTQSFATLSAALITATHRLMFSTFV